MPETTVSGILTRIGMGRLGRLGLEPAERYERKRPGELVHVDVKKLGRIQGGAGWRVRGRQTALQPRTEQTATGRGVARVGWEYVHVCVDDATPPCLRRGLARREGQRPRSAFSAGRFAFFRRYGITVERLLTDNGKAYRSTIHAHCLPHPQPQAPAHTALPAPDQRQGRAVHPHAARRLGLRRRSTAPQPSAPPRLTATASARAALTPPPGSTATRNGRRRRAARRGCRARALCPRRARAPRPPPAGPAAGG